jgi:hypothetical protein
VRPKRNPNDQRLTLFLPTGAVAGRVMRFYETSLEAYLEGEVPRGERLPFTLHLPGCVIAGEMTSMFQDERVCRLQFTALTAADRAHLEPLVEPDL